MSNQYLTNEKIMSVVPYAKNVKELDKGGQKLVYTCELDEEKYILKFIKINLSNENGEVDDSLVCATTQRAIREVETLRECKSKNLVKIGPLGLNKVKIDDGYYLYYSEEFLRGEDLKKYFERVGPINIDELVSLSLNICDAIEELWGHSKVHRDIKPQNIFRISKSGNFVLLDMGVVFDLQDVSLSVAPVGTPLYFSPEQLDFINRRTKLSFRSDLFSLGVVLYEMATGIHPFMKSISTREQLYLNIINYQPPQPDSIRTDLPKAFNTIILRLLAKRPALRYRTIKSLKNDLSKLI